MPYRPSEIEPRWQAYWDEHATFVATERAGVPKFYALDMFPYPSGEGLHVGHPAGYTAGDVVSRYKRARGFNVLHPMGFDAFGLPAEQRAIDTGTPPQASTAEAIARFRGQLKRLGFSYDWSREVSTCDPAFYKWTQWIFTVLHARGLAYEGEAPVNWCPALGTVLANDEVVDGKSERGGHPVEQRSMRQWMLRITAFAERLAAGLDGVDWPEGTRAQQRERLAQIRDWVFARQRYWGEPIPVLKRGGQVVRALELDELPLELPVVQDYAPSGTGEPPLARAQEWVHVTDPATGAALEREVHTMPGSAGSSWYFLRFCDPHNDREFCARAKSDYWMPVDLYVGGPEHAVGHLLYARMWQKALHDAGLVRDDEPFAALRHQGMVLGEVYRDAEERIVPRAEVELRGEQPVRSGAGEALTCAWEKMSKRKGNGVDPDDVIRAYGADALRVYLCFLGPLEADKRWQTEQLEGQANFLRRAWGVFFEGDDDRPRVDERAPDEPALRVIHRAIARVTADIEALKLNTAVSALHVAVRALTEQGVRARAVLEPLAQLIAPFAPHFAEEVWARGLGRAGGISFVPWPAADPRYVATDTVTVAVQVQGRACGTIELAPDASEQDAVAAARAHPGAARRLAGRGVARVVYKPGRVVNLLGDGAE